MISSAYGHILWSYFTVTKTSAAAAETRTITAAEFKAKCLQLMDEVNECGLTLIITKRGKPVMQASAQLAEEKPFRSIVGRSPQIRTLGDIVSLLDWGDRGEEWKKARSAKKSKKRK